MGFYDDVIRRLVQDLHKLLFDIDNMLSHGPAGSGNIPIPDRFEDPPVVSKGFLADRRFFNHKGDIALQKIPDLDNKILEDVILRRFGDTEVEVLV